MGNLAQVGAVAGLIVSIIGGGMSLYGLICWIIGYGDDSGDFTGRNQGIKFVMLGGALVVFGGALPPIVNMQSGHVVAILNHLRNMVFAIGGGLAAAGVIHLLQGYGGELPNIKSRGLKEFKVGIGIAFIGATIPTMLATLATLSGSIADTYSAFALFADGLGDVIFLAGAGIGVWGAVNTIEGIASEMYETRSQGIKQLLAGFVIVITSIAISPLLMSPFAMMMMGGVGDVAGLMLEMLRAIGNIVIAIGIGLSIWGLKGLISGYGTDSPADKSQGGKQFFVGVAFVPLGVLLPEPMAAIATGGDGIAVLIIGAAGIIGGAVAALGAIIGAWGLIGIVEAYGNDSIDGKAYGIKKLLTAIGFILVGRTLPVNIMNIILIIPGGGSPINIILELAVIVEMIVLAVGIGIALWGLINLVEAYGNDDTPDSKSQGIKQFMTGGGLILFGIFVVPIFSVVLATM